VVLWQRRFGFEAGKGMAVATTASDGGGEGRQRRQNDNVSVVGGVAWI